MANLEETGLGSGNGIQRLELLLVGPIGSRKTVTAHHMPRTRTLDFDGRRLQSVEWAIRAGIIKKSLREIEYESIVPSGVREADMAEMLNHACDVVDRWIEEEDEDSSKHWDTLIVDSASFMSDGAMGLALKENQRLGLSKSSENSTKGLKKDQIERGIYLVPVMIQDWGALSNLFMKCIRQWRSLGKNFILIAHEYENTDEQGVVLAIQPNVVGQLRTKLPASFTDVWYTKVKPAVGQKPESVVFRTTAESKRQAKSELGCLSPEEPADFAAVKAKVAKFYGLPTDKLWVAYHGVEGRRQAESEKAQEAEAEGAAI